MDNSSKTFTLVSGIIAFVLVFVLFVVILMTQSYSGDTMETKSKASSSSSSTPSVKKVYPKSNSKAEDSDNGVNQSLKVSPSVTQTVTVPR